MPVQSPILAFRSAKFPVEAGEDEETNPGIFGRALAAWIGQEMVPGFAPDNVIAEDFAWLTPIPHPKHRVYAASWMTDEHPADCRVFVFAEGGFIARFLLQDERKPAVDQLFVELKARLSREPGIKDLREA